MIKPAKKVSCRECGVEFYTAMSDTCPTCRKQYLNYKAQQRYYRTGGKTYDQKEHIDRDTLSPLRVVKIERRYDVCDNRHGGKQDLIRTQATNDKFLCIWCRANEIADSVEH